MQQDNATQTGAESLSPAHAGRNAALAQIAQQVNAGYQEDLAPFDETTGQILPKQAEQKPAQEPAQQPVQAAEEPADEPEQETKPEQQQAAPQAQDDLETIVVDGQQVQVKRSQLFDAGKRTLQKEATADKRLQEATELYRRAQAYEAALRQQAQPSQDAGFQQSPSTDATNGNGQQVRQATPDTRALIRSELFNHEAEKAAQKFMSEFKDIAADPLLMRLAAQLEEDRLTKAAAEGTPLGDPWEAYQRHGETIRARFGKPQTVAQPVVPEDKTERKRSTTTVVGASARLQPSQPKQPPTTAEIIEQQRLARQRGRQIQPAR